MTTIVARVNARLLSKADRLFTGTLDGRIIEVLQNARRAGARQVEILNRPGEVEVRDDGRGIEDFQKLLDLGASGWEEAVEAGEDPAGVGLFSLAPRTVTLESRGQAATIAGEGWRGEAVEVFDRKTPPFGTRLKVVDEPWPLERVERHAVFCGMNVFVDARPCANIPFVSAGAVDHPELGCRIEVRESKDLDSWHRHWQGQLNRCNAALINFHGQVIALEYSGVAEPHLAYLVDLTGAPTELRLMLPARTRMVENAALQKLKQALEREAYRFLQRRGTHRLPYAEYLKARSLGVELPEAEPTFDLGLLSGDDPPPIPVLKPVDLPLSACCRFDPPEDIDDYDSDSANVHLLAALGQFPEPFVPVVIRGAYEGYSWARLRTITRVELTVGKTLHEADLWCGWMRCVARLEIRAHVSDGSVIASGVCMAVPPAGARPRRLVDQHVVYVTPAAGEALGAGDLAHHLGGWSDGGDTYETQEQQFSDQLDRFWDDLKGPHERLRAQLVSLVQSGAPGCPQVTVCADGRVKLHAADGSVVTVSPPT